MCHLRHPIPRSAGIALAGYVLITPKPHRPEYVADFVFPLHCLSTFVMSLINIQILVAKLSFIEQHDKKDKFAFYTVPDAFIGKKKLKDAISNVLYGVK
jgi:hypothetical protein